MPAHRRGMRGGGSALLGLGLGLLLLVDLRVLAAGLGEREASAEERLERAAEQDESGALREARQAERDGSVVRQLEREAKADERGAVRDAKKAAALEQKLGEKGMETKFKRLEREMDGGSSAEAAADVLDLALKQGDTLAGGSADGGTQAGAGDATTAGDAPKEQHVAGADVIPGETAIQSMVQEGEEVLTMMGDAGTTKGRGAASAGGGDGGAKDGAQERDALAEAEVEGGCIGECQGSCLAACQKSLLDGSKEGLVQCERKCEQICVDKCRRIEGATSQAPDAWAARMKMRQRVKEGKSPVEQKPQRKWGWEQKMEEEAASGKQVGPAPVKGKPMDEECKAECMTKCERRCKKKSPTPAKCPTQCTEQCEDDCYIVEGGAPPDADEFMPGEGEEVPLLPFLRVFRGLGFRV